MQNMETKNVKFVAYLRMLGKHPKVEKLGRGRARYHFETITQEEWDTLKQNFDRSEFITYAQCIDAVVDLAY